MSLPNNNGDEFVEEFTDQVQDRPQCLKRRFVEMLDCHDQSVDNMRDRADKALFRTTRRLGLFDKFARLNSAEKRRVRSAILDDPFDYLDGKTSFRDLVARLEASLSDTNCQRRPVFSEFGRTRTRQFLKICKKLMEEAPDVFEIIPPANNGASSKRRTYVHGRCQLGKTLSTMVLVWLHWHFCGCISLIAAWRFRSSVEAFQNGAVDRVNRIILGELGGTSNDNQTALLYAPESKEFELDVLDRAQVLVLLSGAVNFRRVKACLNRMESNVVVKERMDLMQGKYPLVLLMDEDDNNTQTATQNVCATEREINVPEDDESFDETLEFSREVAALNASFADKSYHYVGVTATLHSCAIADAKANADAARRGEAQTDVQLIELRIPHDYYGFAFPAGHERQAIPIKHVHEVDLITSLTDMVEDACLDLDSVGNEVHRTIKLGAGREVKAAVQLIIPRSAKIDDMTLTAEAVADMATEMGSNSLVSTFHGRSDGNTLFFSGFSEDDQQDLLNFAQEFGILLGDNRLIRPVGRGRPNDIGRLSKIKLKGSKVTAPDVMGLFNACIQRWPERRFYCAIISKSRAGRAVTFKCPNHALHLTDMFFEGVGNGSNPSHDNSIQAMHRIAGRYPAYQDSSPPPLTLWTTADREKFLNGIMDLHSQILLKYRGAHAPFTPGGDVFNFVEAEFAKVKLAKPRVNNALRQRVESGNIQRVFSCTLQEARNLSQNFQHVRLRIQEHCSHLRPYVDLIVEGNRVWNQEQITQDTDEVRLDIQTLTERLLAKKDAFRTKACKEAWLRLLGEDLIGNSGIEGYSENAGFHSVRIADDAYGWDATEPNVWYTRMQRRPSGKAGSGVKYDPSKISRVVGFLTRTEGEEGDRSNIVCLATNFRNTIYQMELHRDDQRSWPFVEGARDEANHSKIIAYWCPKGRFEDKEMTLYLDFPDGHGLVSPLARFTVADICGL